MSLFVHFERNASNCTDCTILSLTWMGRVRNEMGGDCDWWTNKGDEYFEDGWLATGNVRGVIGVTLTTCQCQLKPEELPVRANYNLRGHRSHVTLVKWNEPFQKLASCDSSGTIFVWIQHEGRWAIELMNDRKKPVTVFSWSHHGQLALICYQDGFVLVGSVNGQRRWSSMLHLDSVITCGVWTPDDQQVLLGTSSGQILVIDVSGHVETEVTVTENISITSMLWSCHKFNSEKQDESMTDAGIVSPSPRRKENDVKPLLALCLENGLVYLMKSYDDLSPIEIKTQLTGIKMDWSHSGDLLAVAGVSSEINGIFSNWVYFYTDIGTVQYVVEIPYHQEPVTAITWGHLDKRLFIATGCVVNIAWLSYQLASLQLLSAMAVQKCLMDEHSVQVLPLIQCLQSLVSSLFGRTIKCHLPDIYHMREYVSTPPPNNNRLHCTMIHHVDDDITGTITYTLFLENLGGLVPILKGKRVSMLRPEFVIFDPVSSDGKTKISDRKSKFRYSVSCENPVDYSSSYGSTFITTSSSESELDEGCVSPHMQRRRQRLRRLGREHRMLCRVLTSQKYVYIDILPENEKIISITSNIWGTKFKLIGLVPWLPSLLGTVTYRTSLLHLQPRQLKIVMKELKGPLKINLSKFNHLMKATENIATDFSDDEDEIGMTSAFEEGAPVAPMTPKKQKRQLLTSYDRNTNNCLKQKPVDSDYINYLPSDEFVPIGSLILQQQAVKHKTSKSENQNDLNSKKKFTQCPTDSQTEYDGNNIYRGQKQHLSADTKMLGNNVITSERLKNNQNKKVDIRTKIYSKDDNIPTGSKKFNIISDTVHFTESKKSRSEIVKLLLAMDLAVNNPSTLSRWESIYLTNKQEENHPISLNSTSTISSSQNYVNALTYWADKTESKRLPAKRGDKVCEKCLKGVSHKCNMASLVRIGHQNNSVNHLHSVEINIKDRKNVPSLKEIKKRTNLKSKTHQKNYAQEIYQIRKECDNCTGDVTEDNHMLITKTNHNDLHSIHNTNKNIVCLDNQKSCYNVEEKDYQNQKYKNLEERFLNNIPKHNGKKSSYYLHQNNENWQNKESSVYHKECKRNLTRIPDELDDSSEPSSPRISRSIPSSPVGRRKKDHSLKSFLYSPLLLRKLKWQKLVDSSDEDSAFSGDEICNKNGKNFEKSQKMALRIKSKRKQTNKKMVNEEQDNNIPVYHEHVLQNKMPLWNDAHQVYQLDFGGRVTQESAKNFQVEYHGHQVLQFGRINMNAYTLDFQHPFCALQAFAIALANITQRLK